MEYSKEITDMFLIRYRELETIQQNNNSKYQYLLNNYRSELDLFRHIRNDLSHDVVAANYPFIVSKSCLDLLESLLNKVKEKAYEYAKKGKKLVCVYENATIKNVLSLMSKYHFSYIPIVNEQHVIIGVISSDSMIDLLYLNKANNEALVKDYMDLFSLTKNENAFFIFIKKDTYFYELKQNLNNYYNEDRKLGIIFITKSGNKDEPLLGLLTPWDVLKNQD